MEEIKINVIDESDADKELIDYMISLAELAAIDDDNPNIIAVNDTRYTGAYIKNDRLTCIKCHKPLSRLKEKLHVHMDGNIDKSIYQCSCGQYIIKTYPSKNYRTLIDHLDKRL